jgi:adenylate kinase family enzyme
MPDSPGQRIAIIGPSNSGKSTLAATMSIALSLPLLHLDQIAHRPTTHNL